jgi:hypothetical protein
MGAKNYTTRLDGRGNIILSATDGNTGRTEQLLIMPYAGDTFHFFQLGNGKTLFFSEDGHNERLYVTNGTAAGTALLTSIPYAGDNIHFYNLPNGHSVFSIMDGQNVRLVVTDGSVSGTKQLLAVSSAGGDKLHWFNLSNGRSTFSISDGKNVRLFTTDGTTGGTQQLLAVPAAGDGLHWINLANGKSIFYLLDGTGQEKLFTTDGTVAGTQQLASASVAGDHFHHVELADGRDLLAMRDAQGRLSTWITNGTVAGTTRYDGAYTIARGAAIEVSQGLDSGNVQMRFLGSNTLVVDHAAQFGSSVGTPSYQGPQLFAFAAGDKIILKDLLPTSLAVTYTPTTGFLQLMSGSAHVGTLWFDNASLGAGAFHVGNDGAGHAMITHS